ncbi:MAG: tetratricopeptide repeat protein [Rubrivivax sp.]
MSTATVRSHERAQREWLAGHQSSQKGDWSEAARRFRKATKLAPGDVLAYLNLSDVLFKSDAYEDALRAAERASLLEPANPIALGLRANCLASLNRHEQLVELLQALPPERLDKSLAQMLGEAQALLGRPLEAVTALMHAISHDLTVAGLHFRLGLCFNDLQMKREAAECLRTALVLGVGRDEVAVKDLLCYYEREACEWKGGNTQLDTLVQTAEALPEDAAVPTNPFAYVTLVDSPQAQLKSARSTARYLESKVTPLPARPVVPRERLRIGYVSADFHRHATSYLMAELLERHDRNRFEVFVYSHGRDDGTPLCRRVRAAGEHFVDMEKQSIPEMARRIREDGVDILVDLKGYTAHCRPGLFPYRAAPVQVGYLGYPGTTGAPSIDYIIGDPWVTPLEHAPHYSEKIAQIPGCYQCNDATRAVPVPARRADHGLPEDALVLCGFNQPYKISPEVFDVWCGLLHKLPQAVLWLLEWIPQAPHALRREAAARGIDPSRLVFAASLEQKHHLDRMACADIFLDTWPCNGHTTASDALWSGLPMVTMSGSSFASRVAGSLLHALELPELICQSIPEYEALALALADDGARRAELRARIEVARRTSSLFDGADLARRVEALYERMWARALAGLPPDHLPA